jgi:D-alanyl-D-alanine-carboxypeptidase/D-alanyl-D-alanine-endopeptidase
MIRHVLLAAAVLASPSATQAQAPAAPVERVAPQIAATFEQWMQAQHVPGLVYGIVKDGRLVAVRGLGVADTTSGRPVGADTRFRIASMSKAFTAMAILKLRDAGKLSLDAPAETYVPEMKGWGYPTSDSPRITVADLLHHTAGFVEDNPWGDRQQPLGEAAFTAMLKAGVPFAQAPGLQMEYSNFGYATLGRIVANVSGMPYQAYIRRELMQLLGMRATGYDVFASPQRERALGYRWQDGTWVREPDMADGAFGAMGGVETTASDYARWIAFLLSAWPARDGAEAGPVRRATVRGIVEGANFVTVADRGGCRTPLAYGKAWRVEQDCTLGRVVTHTGGYPGYGSVVALLPDAGVGVFAFANRTYAAPVAPVMEALRGLRAAGMAAERTVPVSPELAQAYDAAKAAWRSGDPERAPLAVNVLLDRDATRRRTEIASLKAQVGACAVREAIVPVSAMEGSFVWACDKGRIKGRVQRAPTPTLSLQVLSFAAE